MIVSLLTGEIVDKIDAMKLNDKLKSENKKQVTFEPVLLGITKASLQTKSLYLQHHSRKQHVFLQMHQ